MEDNNELLMKQMEETRTSLSDKLGALESHLEKKAEPIVSAVERTTEAAADIVEEVKETVHEVKEQVQETFKEVKEQVQETVSAVASSLDVRKHVEQHPWFMFGLAATTGCMLGTFLGRRSVPAPEPAPDSPVRHKHGKSNGNGWSHRSETGEKAARKSEASSSPGLFGEELRRLKGLALAALMGTLRELATRSFPGSLGSHLSEEIDNLTVRLGAQPLASPVLGPTVSECQEDVHENASAAPVNRMRSTGTVE